MADTKVAKSKKSSDFLEQVAEYSVTPNNKPWCDHKNEPV
jgi:hypothetical protein